MGPFDKQPRKGPREGIGDSRSKRDERVAKRDIHRGKKVNRTEDKFTKRPPGRTDKNNRKR